MLEQGQTSAVGPGQWHDWWNAADTDALVRVEVAPGERFMHGIETLQLAVFGREFSDTVQFRHPPPVVQRAMFAVLGTIAERIGYRATYPQFSRTVNAPRDPGVDP